jgi:hypothetical protein
MDRSSVVTTGYYEGLRSYQIADVLRAGEPAWNFWYDPRLGKTRVAVRCILRWIHDFGHKTFLIVGPLTPLQVGWMRELRDAGFDTPSRGGGREGFLIPLLEPPTSAQRKQIDNDSSKIQWVGRILRDLCRGAAQGSPVVILLNDDILRYTGRFGTRGGSKSITDLLCDLAPDGLIRDESDRDSNAGSSRAMALRRIGRYTKKRRSLTGTPDPNGYINFFSQFVIVDPDLFGTNKKAFMSRYVATRDLYGREIDHYEHVDELLAKAMSISSIVKAEDYFPKATILPIVREIELPVGVRAMYRELKNTSILETEQFSIDATHQLAKLTRLSQLAIGYLPVNNPETDNVAWVHDEKIKSIVADAAEPLQAGQKIVISHRWKPEGLRIVAALRKQYGERVIHELNGRVTGDRNAIVAPFDIDQDVRSDARIMVAQEVTGGVGISFARADHLHYLSWSFDWGDVYQMEKRIWGPEKQFMTKTFHSAPATIDVYSRRVIDRKENASVMTGSNFTLAAGGMAV